jgi:hypothetical protein
MPDPGSSVVILVDSATATALAQILPVLLLTLTVELRRTKLHRSLPRLRLAMFFAVFGVIETILVLSIDGALYPFQWFDLVTALLILGLLALLFVLALIEPRDSERDG